MATSQHPELQDDDYRDSDVNALASTYRLVADCFVYPERIDREQFVEDARRETIPEIETRVDEESARLLDSFLEEYRDVEVEEYVQTLELSPECPLYLGHYEFGQPETCREITDADRNQYMVELNAIYEHFGFELDDELPDFVPAMAEFLWLTLPDRDDELREEFMSKMASMMPAMIERFEEAGSPYRKPLEALERTIQRELDAETGGDS